MSGIWNSITGVFRDALTLLHDAALEPVFGADSWGWSIIVLTLLIRVLLVPLAVRQFRSMRAMQALQPEIKRIQGKYKVDRELMRKDPERYRAQKEKQNKELMELYQQQGVNPASSCLPLIAQAPVFFALFTVLRDFDRIANAPFYFVTSQISADAENRGLGALISEAGWPGWLLIGLMVVTMFVTQRQMQARNSVEGPAAQQQKILMYVFPVFLAFISFNFPLGVVLYWVTTNIWQMVQQGLILREVSDDGGTATTKEDAPRPQSGPSGNGRKPAEDRSQQQPGQRKSDGGPGKEKKRPPEAARARGRSEDHLPRRRRG